MLLFQRERVRGERRETVRPPPTDSSSDDPHKYCPCIHASRTRAKKCVICENQGRSCARLYTFDDDRVSKNGTQRHPSIHPSIHRVHPPFLCLSQSFSPDFFRLVPQRGRSDGLHAANICTTAPDRPNYRPIDRLIMFRLPVRPGARTF